MKNINKIITLSIIASTFTFAANLPTSGDIQRQVEKPKFEEVQKELPSVAKQYKAPLVMDDSVTTLIKEFQFSGNSVYSNNELKDLIKQFENKNLGMNKLKEITSIITKYYRDNGYFVARAYLPQQTVKDGIIQIAVIEGTYGGFDIKNSSLVNDETTQNYMDYLKNGQIVSSESLERQMLLINELSGVVVTNAEVYPGDEVGTSKFTITTSPTNKYSGYSVVDNYGSRYTGQARLNAGMSVNSISNIGDTLSVSGLVSNTANLKNASANYLRPLGYSGLMGSLNTSITKYELDRIPNYEAFGDAKNIGASLSYPIVKTRSYSQIVSLDYLHKIMNDTSGTLNNTEKSEKSVDSITLKLDEKRGTNIFTLPGKLYSSIGITTGKVNLDNDVSKNNDQIIKTNGNFAKLNLNITHNQQLNPELTLKTTVKGQKSLGKNLDSSEDISVGGSNGVRAYEDSELSGDQGYSLSLDLIYALPKINQINHSASIFADNSKIWINDNKFNDEDNKRNLNAIGLGYDINYKNIDFKTTFAHGFGGESTPKSESEFSTNKNKVLAQGIFRF